MRNHMFKRMERIARDRAIDEYRNRIAIVACLKHGMCPECGSDTVAKYSPAERSAITRCKREGCKFHSTAFIRAHSWLRLHNI